MRIAIAEKLRPFSHVNGIRLLLPRTNLVLQLFPCKVRLFQKGHLIKEIDLSYANVMEQYTVCQDLEAGCVRVWGFQGGKFSRLRFEWVEGVVKLVCEKGTVAIEGRTLAPQECFPLFSCEGMLPVSYPLERLSLGSHRTQEWERLKSQGDLQTILPLWSHLAQIVPHPPSCRFSGTAALLQPILQAPPEKLFRALEVLFRAGFEDLLVPRLEDLDYQGFQLEAPHEDEDALVLLTEGAARIRRLFVHQEARCMTLLPCLPPEFHCGRFLNGNAQDLARFDLEWSKKQVRRMRFCPKEEGEWIFSSRDLRRYRLRRSLKDRGELLSLEVPVQLEKNHTYFFDRFEK